MRKRVTGFFPLSDPPLCGIACILLIGLFAACGGSGTSPDAVANPPEFGTPTGIDVVQSGYPNLKERIAAIYINMARMAPLQYKAKYMPGYVMTGLLEGYPPAPPLALHYDLNRAARSHSEDMNAHSTLTHNTSDGSTTWDARLASFYAGVSPVGEVLVSGIPSPQDAVNLWLYDNGKADHSFPADSSGDGHRMVLMSAAARQMGLGISGSGWWTVDYAGNTPASHPPVVVAGHDFPDSGTIAFWSNYRDAGGSGPQKLSCFVDGAEEPLSLDTGSAAQGTYKVVMAKSAATRAYYFLALDKAGVTWRYPGTGHFMTVGEGTGTTDYLP
jgi:hypothetical protein